jgi:hypothetical protein
MLPAIVALSALLFTDPNRGPKLIVFGGGQSPDSNQRSLETQVDALAKALGTAHPWVLFGPPDASARSVQTLSPKADPIDELLGLVFDRQDGLGVEYKPIAIARQGPTTKGTLLSALE